MYPFVEKEAEAFIFQILNFLKNNLKFKFNLIGDTIFAQHNF